MAFFLFLELHRLHLSQMLRIARLRSACHSAQAALGITKVWRASEELSDREVLYLWQSGRLTTTSYLDFVSSTVDHGPTATSVTAKWPHVHNTEEEGKKERTPQCWKAEG
jgi:hypothetical protein